jgi:hypothetical protein
LSKNREKGGWWVVFPTYKNINAKIYGIKPYRPFEKYKRKKRDGESEASAYIIVAPVKSHLSST